MEHNKDKGTSVGFSKGIIEQIRENSPKIKYEANNLKISDIEQSIADYNKNKSHNEELIPFPMNKVCKEHEWVENIYSTFAGNRRSYFYCKNCPEISKTKPIDFKVDENIEVIENNKWEDIEKEYEDSPKFLDESYTYQVFLIENYTAPEKK